MALAKNLARLTELQHLLYADKRHALLIVLQALDAGGKDGTIRHVMSGVNPQGCEVTSFKAPSSEELEHDFLWRIHKAVPRLGDIGIFNRSQYEDVLIVRVHQLAPKKVWSKRYRQINEFERILADNGVTILKFYLHISKDEQKKRFEARIAGSHQELEAVAARFRRTQALGRLHAGLRSGAAQMQHGLCALVYHSGERQMVSKLRYFSDYREHARRLAAKVSCADNRSDEDRTGIEQSRDREGVLAADVLPVPRAQNIPTLLLVLLFAR